jgi:cell division transport system permease protein
MLWTNIKRVVKAGFVSFWRNGFVSLTSVLVMTVTLFVIGSVLFLLATLNSSLAFIENKVDVNVYLSTSASESDINTLKNSLQALPEVKSIDYVSKEQALEEYKKRHENDTSGLEVLDELPENPLSSVLNIKAKKPGQYETIASFLKNENTLSADSKMIIRKVNYEDNKKTIDVLIKIIASAQKLGFAVTLVLVIISILIIFNTIRLVIYSAREEISVMRLVGASNKYIRGPFVVSGIIYGALAGILTLIIFYPLTYWLGADTQDFFSGINVYRYYIVNFGQIFGIIMGSGVVLGAISSYLAVRRYLQI